MSGNGQGAQALARDKARALALCPVSRETEERLDRFVDVLLRWQDKLNLVSPSTLPILWTRHIADSLQLLPLAPQARTWVDLGSGGGFPGVVITSETEGRFIDDPAFEPFWAEAEKLGLFVFVHPALKLNFPQQFDAYDTARSVGREFSLIMATIRLINSGVFDRHPSLIVHMAHLGGGIASMLGRIRGYQDKDFWGTADNPRHGAKPRHELDHYLRQNVVFDTAGFCGALGAVKAALIEIPASRIVFATDYPQEIRERAAVREFVEELRALGGDGEAILSGNVRKLLRLPAEAESVGPAMAGECRPEPPAARIRATTPRGGPPAAAERLRAGRRVAVPGARSRGSRAGRRPRPGS